MDRCSTTMVIVLFMLLFPTLGIGLAGEVITFTDLRAGLKLDQQFLKRYGEPKDFWGRIDTDWRMGYGSRGREWQVFVNKGYHWTVCGSINLYKDSPLKHPPLALRLIVNTDETGKVINYHYLAVFFSVDPPSLQAVQRAFESVYGEAQVLEDEEGITMEWTEDNRLLVFPVENDPVPRLSLIGGDFEERQRAYAWLR